MVWDVASIVPNTILWLCCSYYITPTKYSIYSHNLLLYKHNIKGYRSYVKTRDTHDLFWLVNCFLQNWSIDTFKHKTDKYSVHFQEMPGFKGKRKGGLTDSLQKNISIYNVRILPVSLPRKRTKTYSALKILLKCHFHFLGQT
jgi:hypothetical protein